jgi:hypothetical protein
MYSSKRFIGIFGMYWAVKTGMTTSASKVKKNFSEASSK